MTVSTLIDHECDFMKLKTKEILIDFIKSGKLIDDIVKLIDIYVENDKRKKLEQFIIKYGNYPFEFKNKAKYREMIKIAIEYSDIQSFYLLFGGLGYVGISSIDGFSEMSYYSVRFGNIPQICQILYYYDIYKWSRNGSLSIKKLKELASLNPNKSVKVFIDKLFEGIPELLNDRDTFNGLYYAHEEDYDESLSSSWKCLLEGDNEMYKSVMKELKLYKRYLTNFNKLIQKYN